MLHVENTTMISILEAKKGVNCFLFHKLVNKNKQITPKLISILKTKKNHKIGFFVILVVFMLNSQTKNAGLSVGDFPDSALKIKFHKLVLSLKIV